MKKFPFYRQLDAMDFSAGRRYRKKEEFVFFVLALDFVGYKTFGI